MLTPAPGTAEGEATTPVCAERCPMCGSTAPAVFVHGHLQCGACGVNIDPCCGGAPPVSDGPAADQRG